MRKRKCPRWQARAMMIEALVVPFGVGDDESKPVAAFRQRLRHPASPTTNARPAQSRRAAFGVRRAPCCGRA